MHLPRLVWPVLAALVTAALVAAPGIAGAQSGDRAVKQFATGSGKADAAGTALEHLSFTAHSDPGIGCPARGSLEYERQVPAPQLHLKARVTNLVITGFTLGPLRAFVVGEIQYYAENGQQQPPPTPFVWFSVTDSGLPGGEGDQILFEPLTAMQGCVMPAPGTPITHGNILIQFTGLKVVP